MFPITFQSENSKLEKKKLNFKITKLNCCLWQSTRREITITIEREGLESLKSCTVKMCLPGNQTPGQGDTLWKGRGILDKCKEVLVCLAFNKVSHLMKLGMVGTCAMPKKRRVFRVGRSLPSCTVTLGYCSKDAGLIPLGSMRISVLYPYVQGKCSTRLKILCSGCSGQILRQTCASDFLSF